MVTFRLLWIKGISNGIFLQELKVEGMGKETEANPIRKIVIDHDLMVPHICRGIVKNFTSLFIPISHIEQTSHSVRIKGLSRWFLFAPFCIKA